MSQINVDSIVDKAGTGATDFPEGLSFSAGGATDLDYFATGTWTPSIKSSTNMTITTPAFGTARWLRIGDTVIATIVSINAATFTITTQNTDTNFALNITDLPTPATGSGTGYLRVNSGYYPVIPIGIAISSTQITVNINASTGVGVSSGCAVTGAAFIFIYQV